MFQTYMSIAWVHYMAGDVAAASRWYIRTIVGSSSLRDVTGTTIGIPVAALLGAARGAPGRRWDPARGVGPSG